MSDQNSNELTLIPFVQYNKEIVSTIIKIKESIKQSISNENNFCNTYGEISIFILTTFRLMK